MRTLKRIIILPVLLFGMLSSCAVAPVDRDLPAEKKPAYLEQENKALEAFAEILEISRSSSDRREVISRMERKYKEIINKFPDTPIAQESHLKLIEIYLNEYDPPSYEKSENTYKSFSERYPASPLEGYIQETIAKSLFKKAQWERLADHTSPIFKDYINKSRSPRPILIFYYAESNFNLARLNDAEEGYRLVNRLFPGANVSVKARTRLEEIEKNKK